MLMMMDERENDVRTRWMQRRAGMRAVSHPSLASNFLKGQTSLSLLEGWVKLLHDLLDPSP